MLRLWDIQHHESLLRRLLAEKKEGVKDGWLRIGRRTYYYNKDTRRRSARLRRMNGGGGGPYMTSEDDFDDYKPSLTGHHLSTGPSYFSSSQGSSGGGGGLPTTVGGGSGGGGGGFGGSSTVVGNNTATGPSSSTNAAAGRNQVCCLIDDGKRCTRLAGTASYNKRIQKTVHFKRLKLESDILATHIYICDHHKMVIQKTRQKKDSDDDLNDGDDVPDVDLFQLQVNTLRRYKKHFKISTRPGLNKAQLTDILSSHFKTIPVQNEKEVITYFIYMIKSGKNKLDSNNRAEGGTGAAGANAEYNSERY